MNNTSFHDNQNNGSINVDIHEDTNDHKSETLKRALTEKQAADYLAVSRSLLRQSRMNGVREGCISGPPWIKLGSRSIRYLKEDLDQWLESFPKESPNVVTSEV